MSTKSGRRGANDATRSMSRFASSVVSSSGCRCGIASARQWTQASAQARVVSQMTMNGADANG